MVIVWRRHPSTTDATWTWQTIASQRELKQILFTGHTADVYDVAWSPHSTHLVTGSIDHTMIVWGVRDGCHPLQVVRDHRHYVQGVAWDPLDRVIVSQSSDRTCKLYAIGSGAAQQPLSTPIAKKGGSIKRRSWANVACKHTLRHRAMEDVTAGEEEAKVEGTEGAAEGGTAAAGETASTAAAVTARAGARAIAPTEGAVAAAASGAGGGAKEGDAKGERAATPVTKRAPQHRLFCDENNASFFRRLAWTPDGALLITPAALYQASAAEEAQPVSYGWVRGQYKVPLAMYPGLKTSATAVAACPLLFSLWAEDTATPAAASVRSLRTAAGGSADVGATGAAPIALIALPYRVVWAVATHDEVIIYDSQFHHALVRFAAMHYAPITDLRWSQSGRSLAVSSQDGYCSFVSFAEGELGEVLPSEQWPKHMAVEHRTVFVEKAKKRRVELSEAPSTTGGNIAAVVSPPAASAAAAPATTVGSAADAPGQKKKKRRVMMQTINAGDAVVGDAFK